MITVLILFFSYLFACVLRDIRADLNSEEVLTAIPWAEALQGRLQPVGEGDLPASTLPLLDSTWMDDLAIMLVAPTAAALPEVTVRATRSLVDHCMGRGLVPNLARGKTEIIMVPLGAGSRGVRAGHFKDKEPSLALDTASLGLVRVRLVSQYQHLGGVVHHTGTVLREVRHRIALAHEAFTKHKKKIFTWCAVSFLAKATLFESLVLSVLLYGAGTWATVDGASKDALSHAYVMMAAKMLRPRFSFEEALKLGPDKILMLLGLPSLEVLLHVSRLRHLMPCLRLRIKEIWALAHWEGRWLGEIRSSLDWLREFAAPELPSWEAAWPAWQDMIAQHPGRWKALLCRTQAKATRRESWTTSGHQMAGLLLRQLKQLGGVLAGTALDAAERRHACALCCQVFQDYNKWSLHAFKKHSRVMQGRGILAGSQCQACLRHFRTNVQLCRHLRFTPTCRARLQQAGFNCPLEPGIGSKKAPDPAASQAPVLQAEGPLLPLALPDLVDERRRPVAEVLDCLHHLDFDGFLQVASDKDIWQRLKLSFGCTCAPTDRLRITASLWAQSLSSECAYVQDRLRPFADWICQADLVEWLVPTPTTVVPALCTFRDSLTSLSLLDTTAALCVEPAVGEEDITVIVAPAAWTACGGSAFWRRAIHYTHEECLQSLEAGALPTFFEGPFDGTRFVLSTWTLPSLASNWPSTLPEKRFQQHVTAASFAGDLVRFFVRLLASGTPAVLIVPDVPDLCLAAIASLPQVMLQVQGQAKILRNWDSVESALFHPFLN